jgi:plastocyanin
VVIDRAPIPALLTALENPVDGIRHRARVELSERSTAAVIAATKEWIKRFDPKKAVDAHHLLEALWVHQQHNVVNQDLLGLVLNSPSPQARTAARRVERMWTHRAARSAAGDATPVVRNPVVATSPDDGAIVIKTVAEGMRYELPMYTVTAGKPVKMRFVNNDFTPHNMVIGTPGSREEIGVAADQLGSNGFAQRFIPKSDKILAASDLLNHQKFEILEFQAPTVPGDYEILCTFPGHRQSMHAILRVAK